jgi:hypothetical protein
MVKDCPHGSTRSIASAGGTTVRDDDRAPTRLVSKINSLRVVKCRAAAVDGLPAVAKNGAIRTRRRAVIIGQ